MKKVRLILLVLLLVGILLIPSGTGALAEEDIQPFAPERHHRECDYGIEPIPGSPEMCWVLCYSYFNGVKQLTSQSTYPCGDSLQ